MYSKYPKFFNKKVQKRKIKFANKKFFFLSCVLYLLNCKSEFAIYCWTKIYSHEVSI